MTITTDNPEREQAIATAIRERRIPAARAGHYRERWDRNPSGTAAILRGLAPAPDGIDLGPGSPAMSSQEREVRRTIGLGS